ncbi:acetate/propionate family kinase [Euzebya tangerina]|uniref:acetate/propionate family kinase n=1 Tax=Euzebya tangerina TaxID=591198 RepID=UPI000E312B65|nr:acetate kinase [Euzebya tangerina]
MTVLVLNCGSSSIKYEVFTPEGDGDPLDTLQAVTGGIVEGIGEAGSQVPDHAAGLDAIASRLREEGLLDDLSVIGHRVVHGGEAFTQPTIVDDAVIETLEQLSPLAPLHNPPILEGIRVARALRPDLPHVAVFDTAFHGTLPQEAYRYAVPQNWYDDHGVRRYGFHGTSHDYVARRAAQALGRPLGVLKLITLHLGNGASACAVDGGRSVDTSMGLSPLEGLVMGTRSGDVDPTVIFHLLREGLSPGEVETALNRQSGLVGLSGSNDMRAVEAAAADGDPAAELAIQVAAHRLRKYVGAYIAVLGGLDAVVFTGGIGEHSARMRAAVVEPLGHLGLSLDAAVNASCNASDGPVDIGTGSAAVLVVATDEERMIAAQSLECVSSGS